MLLSVIKLLSISINNLCNFLKFANGVEPEKTPYSIPENNELFNKCWVCLNSMSQMQFSIDIKSDQIGPFSSREINSMLKKQQTKPD